MRPGRRAVAALLVVAGVVVGAPGIERTAATVGWDDVVVARTGLTTGASDCSSTGVFLQSGSARLLAGTVRGAAVPTAAGLAGAAVGPTDGAISTSRTVAVDSTGPSPVIGGRAAPFAMTAGATFAQTAGTTGTGAATAAVSGSAAFGTVDVSGLLPDGALPALDAVALDVGRPTARAAYDGCARAWGAGLSSALTRSAAVDSLTLRFRDAAATRFTGAVGTTTAQVAAGLDAFTTTSSGPGQDLRTAVTGAAGPAVVAGVQAVLGSLLTVSPVSTATVVPAAAATGSAQVFADPAGAASLRVDGGVATVSADLGALAGGLASPAPNTAVLTGARLSTLGSSLGVALARQRTATTTAWRTAADSSTIRLQTTASVLNVLGVQIGTVAVDLTNTAAGWRDGDATTLTGSVTSLLGGPALDAAVRSRVLAALAAPVRTAFSDAAGTVISTQTTALDDALATASTSASADVATLGGVLVPVLDVQADQSPAPSGWTGAAAPDSWAASALQVRVVSGGSALLDLFVGDVSVGPVAPPG